MEEVAAGKARLLTVDSLTDGTMRRATKAGHWSHCPKITVVSYSCKWNIL